MQRHRLYTVSKQLLASASLAACLVTLAACDERVSLTTSNNGAESQSTASSGIVVSSASTGSSRPSTTDASSSSDRTPQPLSSLESGTTDCGIPQTTTPRGLSCIHCLHDNATEQAQEIIQILASSCLENVAVSYLVDGSFGSDPTRIKEHVRTLRSAGKRPFVHLYLLNGASQRQWKTTPVDGLFTRTSPENFRRRIASDISVRARLESHVRSLTPTLRSIESAGGVISLVPMLEDNLTEDSFQSLSDLILDTLPSDLSVSIGRNACVGCYSRNDDGLPDGYFAESHGKDADSIPYDGVFSNDGVDISLNGRGIGSKVISLSDARILRDRARRNNTMFILWNAEYQGLRAINGGVRGTGISPDERVYAFPTRAEAQRLVSFLNGN